MTVKLKIASSFVSSVGPQSTTIEIMQALLKAYAESAGPSTIEADAGLAAGSLEPEYEALGLIDRASDNPAVKLASDFFIERCESGASLRFDGKAFREYENARWRRREAASLRRNVYVHMRRSPEVFGPPSLDICRAAVSELEIFCHREAAEEDAGIGARHILNLRSQELHVGATGAIELCPQRPWSEQTSVCAYDHDPDATCPRFDQALKDILSANDDPAEMERHLMEVLAYGVLSWRDIACIVFFNGAGANGKSLLLRIVASLLGTDQSMWGSVRRLTGDKFSLPEIEGKRLFIEDDAPDDVAIDQGLLKSIAEDKPLMVRRAYAAHSTAIRASILPIISSNGAPRFVETSHGFARRILAFPFRRRFGPHEADLNLAATIIATERPGILNRLIEAHARLRDRGRFAPPEECVRATREMLALGNGLQAYLDEMTTTKPGGRTPLSEVYGGYIRWEKANGGRPMFTRNKLKSKLQGMGLTVGKSVGEMCVHDLVLVGGMIGEVANDHAH